MLLLSHVSIESDPKRINAPISEFPKAYVARTAMKFHRSVLCDQLLKGFDVNQNQIPEERLVW